MVKKSLPMFPDFVYELTASWSNEQYNDLDNGEEAGLANPLPVEPFVAAYLVQSHNHGVGGPTTMAFKHCRFSASQLHSIYWVQAGGTCD